MSNKNIIAAENGTYSTAAPNPHVELDGTFPASAPLHQVFDNPLNTGGTVTIIVRKATGGETNWAWYAGASFTSGTPDELDLSGATLLDSEGTLSNSDSVEVWALLPHGQGYGTSFPVAADFPEGAIPDGFVFYHQTYKVLFVYEQGWYAQRSFGDLTLYVDGTSGSDTAGNGFASGASAAATIQWLWDTVVPAVIGGNVVINISGTSYAEDLALGGKNYAGSYYVTLKGTVSATGYTVHSVANTGTDAADRATRLELTSNGVLGSGVKFVRMTSGGADNGHYIAFESGDMGPRDYLDLTNTALSTSGQRTVDIDANDKLDDFIPSSVIAAADTLDVYTISTSVTSIVVDGQSAVNLAYLDVGSVEYKNGAQGNLAGCDIGSATGSTVFQTRVGGKTIHTGGIKSEAQTGAALRAEASINAWSSYFLNDDSGAARCVDVLDQGYVRAWGSRVEKTSVGANARVAVQVNQRGYWSGSSGTVYNDSTSSSGYAVSVPSFGAASLATTNHYYKGANGATGASACNEVTADGGFLI